MLVPNRFGSSNSYRYGFQGQEKDNEIKGEGNSYTAEFWQYDPRIGRRWNIDPVDKAWMSSYHSFNNNPILNIDPYGDDPGDYLTKDGKHLGSDGIKDDRVYVADSVTKNEKGLVTSAENKQELSIKYSKFATIANIVKHEAPSNDPNETLYIAHTSNNNAKAAGVSLYKKLMSGFSSVEKENKVPMPNGNSTRSKFARAALISVLTGQEDPTGGATFWDGTDFLAWGLSSPNGTPQNKFEEYNGILIPRNIFNDFKQSQLAIYAKGRVKYGAKFYALPASVFTDSDNWTDNNFYNGFFFDCALKLKVSGNYAIEATVTAGRSIFWKKFKNPQASPPKTKK